MEPITRKEAQEQGLRTYFTGKPCKHGHVAPRQTSKGVCVECHNQYARSDKGRATQRRIHARRAASDPDYVQKLRDNAKRHYHSVQKQDDKQMLFKYEKNAEYQKNNRKRINRIRRAFNARNPGYGREHVVARRAHMRHSELTPHEQQQVRAIYKLRTLLSRATGVMYHVDHHIPLKEGGLHHPDNLWIITAEENLRKGAKMPA